MDFETWTLQGKDVARRKRMAFSMMLGVGVVAAAVGVLAATSEGIELEEAEEEIRDVELATEPEPEPEPPPEVEEPKAPPPKFEAPREIPTEAPEEAEPEVNPYAGDPLQYGVGQTGEEEKPAVVEAPVEKPKPKLTPKPKPKGPLRLSEEGTPPECPIRPPDYPAEAKAAGIQGTVFVKYVVTATGEVTDVRAVRGPAELKAAAVSALQGVRCKPALEGGQPVSVIRLARFPFTLK